MLKPLTGMYRSIQERKVEMLAALDALTDEEQRRITRPGDWSPLQILEHVFIVEEWMSGPLPPASSRVLPPGYLFMWLGVGSLRSGRRMPTLREAEPSGTLDFDTIQQRWDAARERLTANLETVTTASRRRPIALHPVAGPLHAQQVLELLDAHLAYHLPQIPKPIPTAR